jgi:hypothetical protein
MDLYDTAQSLLQSQRWKLYLTPDEGRVFQFMMESEELFEALLRQPTNLVNKEALMGIRNLD